MTSLTTKSKTIKITYWNANGLRHKIGELIHYIDKHNVDIIIISETRLDENIKLKFKKFKTYRQDVSARRGGIALLIRQNIPHQLIQNIDTIIENITIKLQNKTIICGAYAKPRIRINDKDYDNIFNLGNKVLILGDLNCRHKSWNNKLNNRNGNNLLHYIEQHNIQIKTTNIPTHYPENSMTPTYIDIGINKNITKISELTVHKELSSDHLPIYIELYDKINTDNETKTWTFKNTNWKIFGKLLTAEIQIQSEIKTPEKLDEVVDSFTKILQKTRDKTATKISLKPKEDNLPTEILDLIKFKNKIKNKWTKHRRLQDRIRLQALQDTIKDKITTHKNNAWSEILRGLSVQDNSLWKLTKRLKNKFQQIPSLDNTTAQTNKEKAETLAITLKQTFCEIPDNTERQKDITKTAKEITNTTKTTTHEENKKLLITAKQLSTILKQLPPNKAPGSDEIANIILKNLPKKAFIQLLHIINNTIRHQHFPTPWKNSIIIPILKPNKNPNEPKSYRPISLLPAMSKVTEKCILNKILDAELDKIIPDTQLGFKKGNSTIHALAKLTQDATNNFNKQHSTVTLALDLEKAFDTVWHNGLIYKLHKIHKIPLHFTKLIHSYITDRTFQVKVGSDLSKIQKTKAGVPQGTVLSPILFNMYVADIPDYINTETLQFADDTILYAGSFSAATACSKIKQHLTKLLPWYEQWKLNINTNKSACSVLTRKFTNINIFMPPIINKQKIQVTKQIKYLGVILDQRLKFVQNVSHTLQKTFLATQSLYALLSPKSQMSLQNKLTIYKAIIRPVMTYAAPIWCGMSDTQYYRLQKMQNKLLRSITKSDRYVRVQELHDMTKIQYIQEHCLELANKFYETKINNTPITADLTKIKRHHEHKHKPIYHRLQVYQQ